MHVLENLQCEKMVMTLIFSRPPTPTFTDLPGNYGHYRKLSPMTVIFFFWSV